MKAFGNRVGCRVRIGEHVHHFKLPDTVRVIVGQFGLLAERTRNEGEVVPGDLRPCLFKQSFGQILARSSEQHLFACIQLPETVRP